MPRFFLHLFCVKKINLFKSLFYIFCVQAKQDLAAVVGQSIDIDLRRSAQTLKKQSDIDQDEIIAIALEKKKFLLLALQHYLKGLRDSNEHDLLVFRAVCFLYLKILNRQSLLSYNNVFLYRWLFGWKTQIPVVMSSLAPTSTKRSRT